MMSRSLEARIAVLEERSAEHEKDLLQAYKDIKEHMDREEEDREALFSKVTTVQKELFDVREEMAKYKGTIGGIVLTVSAIFTALGAGLGAAVKYLSGS